MNPPNPRLLKPCPLRFHRKIRRIPRVLPQLYLLPPQPLHRMRRPPLKRNWAERGWFLCGDGYTCKLPEGWKLLEEDSSQVVFVPDNYPEKSANTISVQVSEKDASFDSYTREDFEAAAEKEYASLDAFQFSDYKKDTFGEFNMYMVEYSVKKDDVPIVFQQYFIDASEQTVIVIFTSVNGSDLTEAKEAFLKSLTVK